MALIVQKYGGTSVADADRIMAVARRVADCYQEGNQVVVVVSALGHTTDELIELAQQVTLHPPEREMDMLLATGEQQSIALLAMAIYTLGLPAVSLTGPQVAIITDGAHAKARIIRVETERITRELQAGKIVIVAGFQGISQDNEITTLGRGGSDTTAVALAAALQADVCEIYTDVEGVFTADPRVVPEASRLASISYDEMLELASLGAQVLQPRSVEFAKQFGIRLHVRSSFNQNSGTMVEEGEVVERDTAVTGVACDLNVAKIGIFGVPDRPGIAARLFGTLAARGINVDMIVQSTTTGERNNISFTVARTDLDQAVATVKQVTGEIGASGLSTDAGVAKVSIVGAGMITNPGVAAQMFTALAQEGINIDMISTSEIKISCVIRQEAAAQAVKALHRAFRLGEAASLAVGS